MVDKTGIMQVKSERMITGKESVSNERRGFEHKVLLFLFLSLCVCVKRATRL